MFQLYDKLLQFSLFRGLSYNDLTQIVAHTKFDFRKYEVGQTVATEGETCGKLCLLTDGILQTMRWSDDHSYCVVEEMPSPEAFLLERLFGLRQHFTATYTALTPCNLMLIDKREVMRLMDTFVIFHINVLNIVTTQAQKLSDREWHPQPAALDRRVARFLTGHCSCPSGCKSFHIRMEQLAVEVNDSRLNVSRVLNNFQDRGLVFLKRGRIDIPRIERLEELFRD